MTAARVVHLAEGGNVRVVHLPQEIQLSPDHVVCQLNTSQFLILPNQTHTESLHRIGPVVVLEH